MLATSFKFWIALARELDMTCIGSIPEPQGIYTNMFELSLTFLLAAFVSAGVAFFGIAGDASELIAGLAWVFVALFAAALGAVLISHLTRSTTA